MFCIYLLFSHKKLNFSLSIKNAEIIHYVSSNKVQVPGTNKFVTIALWMILTMNQVHLLPPGPKFSIMASTKPVT